MKVVSDTPWLKGLKTISLPIAHVKEISFLTRQSQTFTKSKQIALQYITGEMSEYLDLPANPNGSIANISSDRHESKNFALFHR